MVTEVPWSSHCLDRVTRKLKSTRKHMPLTTNQPTTLQLHHPKLILSYLYKLPSSHTFHRLLEVPSIVFTGSFVNSPANKLSFQGVTLWSGTTDNKHWHNVIDFPLRSFTSTSQAVWCAIDCLRHTSTSWAMYARLWTYLRHCNHEKLEYSNLNS